MDKYLKEFLAIGTPYARIKYIQKLICESTVDTSVLIDAWMTERENALYDMGIVEDEILHDDEGYEYALDEDKKQYLPRIIDNDYIIEAEDLWKKTHSKLHV